LSPLDAAIYSTRYLMGAATLYGAALRAIAPPAMSLFTALFLLLRHTAAMARRWRAARVATARGSVIEMAGAAIKAETVMRRREA